MTSPLDLWDSVPSVLAWIAISVIQLAKFAHAEMKRRLPPRPFPFNARQLIGEVGAWTVVAIGNSAYARGQITFATLAAAGLVAALASTLIAGKTP
jgi:hypothetical protein